MSWGRASSALAKGRAAALDHAGAEIALDPFQFGGWGDLEEGGLELQPMGPVVQPDARRLDELASTEGCCSTHHGDQVALTTHLDPQHTEAVVGVVEGYPLETRPASASRSTGGTVFIMTG